MLWPGTVWGSNPGRGKIFISSPKCPDWLWGLPILLFSGYWGQAVMLNIHHHQVLRLRMRTFLHYNLSTLKFLNLRNIVNGELVVTVIGFSRITKFHAFALPGIS
jgi:hypothetical protein